MSELIGNELLYCVPVDGQRPGAFQLETTTGAVPALGGMIARVTLSTSQLLALNTTAVTIVPAPGVGKFIAFQLATYETKFASAGYTMSPNSAGYAGLFYGTASGPPADLSAGGLWPFVTTGNAVVMTSLGLGNGFNTSDLENQPLILGVSPGFSLVGGNGSGVVTVRYGITDL